MGKILIVDDSKTIRRVIASYVEKDGHEAITAENGEEGIKKIIENKDIVLMVLDVHMPIMGGIEMLESLRKDKRTWSINIPIIMLTTEQNPRLMQKARNFGIKAWLIKPATYEHISDTITHLLA
ncbi:MAG: response regulator [Oligoflexales bacterium]